MTPPLVQLEVRPSKDGKEWGAYIQGVLVGSSKSRVDADHALKVMAAALRSGGVDSVNMTGHNCMPAGFGAPYGPPADIEAKDLSEGGLKKYWDEVYREQEKP